MYFDGFDDIGAYEKVEDRAVSSGPTFPPVGQTGELFKHDTHGLCIFCHDKKWRKVIEQ